MKNDYLIYDYTPQRWRNMGKLIKYMNDNHQAGTILFGSESEAKKYFIDTFSRFMGFKPKSYSVIICNERTDTDRCFHFEPCDYNDPWVSGEES